MFFENQKIERQKEYIELLKLVGSLSNMFSESPVPYLYYRAAENIFCRSFNAENLSRGDVSADASFEDLGIGLKTFLHNNGSTLQKVAEFNRGASDYQTQDCRDIVETISKQRNERINFTIRAHDLNQMIYHLVTREYGRFNIYEENMDLINLGNIRGINERGNSIFFRDDLHEYKFDKSKSTLFKRFITKNPVANFEVSILKDPYAYLLQVTDDNVYRTIESEEIYDQIYLPLYSPMNGNVQNSSGLNQWNASGRVRHQDEVYIPIPIWIHRNYSGFFPFNLEHYKEAKENKKKYESPLFILELPNGEELSARVCQENGKALMSNPNRDLGKWLLRHVLQIPVGQLVTYRMLEQLGIDSVVVTKISDFHFRIDFAGLGSYEDFEEEFRY